mmetsp:Transcript_2312/g.2954  ORF Transcript_2312/g.2954 Transcript_2312/m.2954 type:complete len:121 (+) Transcript_2312:845-1207(+)
MHIARFEGGKTCFEIYHYEKDLPLTPCNFKTSVEFLAYKGLKLVSQLATGLSKSSEVHIEAANENNPNSVNTNPRSSRPRSQSLSSADEASRMTTRSQIGSSNITTCKRKRRTLGCCALG